MIRKISYVICALIFCVSCAAPVLAASITVHVTPLYSPPGQPSTYIIAASNSSTIVKAKADYVCNGTSLLTGTISYGGSLGTGALSVSSPATLNMTSGAEQFTVTSAGSFTVTLGSGQVAWIWNGTAPVTGTDGVGLVELTSTSNSITIYGAGTFYIGGMGDEYWIEYYLSLGNVQLCSGTYNLFAPIYLTSLSDVTLTGQTNTLIQDDGTGYEQELIKVVGCTNSHLKNIHWIKNNALSGGSDNGYGIYFSNSNNCSLEDCFVQGTIITSPPSAWVATPTWGVVGYYCNNLDYLANKVSGTQFEGLSMWYSDSNAIISQNTVHNCGMGIVCEREGTKGCVISDNVIFDDIYESVGDILIRNATGCTVTGNTLSALGSSLNGTVITGAGVISGSPLTIYNENVYVVTVSGPGSFTINLPVALTGIAEGGCLNGTPVTLTSGSNSLSATGSGTFVILPSGTPTGKVGVEIDNYSEGNNISNNTMVGYFCGLETVNGSNNNVFDSNIMTACHNAIQVYSNSNIFQNNTIQYYTNLGISVFADGVTYYNADSNEFLDNRISGGGSNSSASILVNSGNNNEIDRNIIDFSNGYGIQFAGTSRYNTISSNQIVDDYALTTGIKTYGAINSGDYSFTVDANPCNIVLGQTVIVDYGGSHPETVQVIGEINGGAIPDQEFPRTFIISKAFAYSHLTNLNVNGVNVLYHGIEMSVSLTNAANATITNNIIRNTISSQIDWNPSLSASTVISNNQGYIAAGEVRTISGIITGGSASSIALSIINPFSQAVRVVKVDIEITAESSVPSTLDVGIGSISSSDYNGMWPGLNVHPGGSYPYFYTSTSSPGSQTVPINWASGSGNQYLNFYTTATGASTGLVATYTVTVMGN
jgi:Right handed beta helix region/Periplasmic copper-binding protein (NosD)